MAEFRKTGLHISYQRNFKKSLKKIEEKQMKTWGKVNMPMRKKKKMEKCHSGEGLSSSSCEQSGPVLALIIFGFRWSFRTTLFDFPKVGELCCVLSYI